ncbi:zinc ribbon domain-containing protein [bacterium]|nr:zinc ribbon domain-containing protein [bacterium]
MLCPRCQTECAEDNNFCHKCGLDLHGKKVHDNLSLKLPSANAESNITEKFLPIHPSLTKAEAVKPAGLKISLSKKREDTETAAKHLELCRKDTAAAERADGEVPAAPFSVSSEAEPKVSLRKEASGSAADRASAADSGMAFKQSGPVEVFADKGAEISAAVSAEGSAAAAAENEADVSEDLSSAEAETAPGSEEVYVGIPQRVSVFSGHDGSESRRGSGLNTDQLVDKTLSEWNNFDVQPKAPERPDEHVGLKAEPEPVSSENGPFSAVSRPENFEKPPAPTVGSLFASEADRVSKEPEPGKTRLLKAEDGEEIGAISTEFQTVKNVFSSGNPSDPTSEAYSQREHAKAIINEVPRAGSKGNDSASAGKVGIVIASCGCLVVFALVVFSLFVYFFCF